VTARKVFPMARCKSCTAPLPPHSGVCEYCGSSNDVDLKGIHEFTVNRPESPRRCPQCGIPLQTLDLGTGGKFYIERCENCLGLFFDPGPRLRDSLASDPSRRAARHAGDRLGAPGHHHLLGPLAARVGEPVVLGDCHAQLAARDPTG